jgi:hypothetical protein
MFPLSIEAASTLGPNFILVIRTSIFMSLTATTAAARTNHERDAQRRDSADHLHSQFCRSLVYSPFASDFSLQQPISCLFQPTFAVYFLVGAAPGSTLVAGSHSPPSVWVELLLHEKDAAKLIIAFDGQLTHRHCIGAASRRTRL